MFDNVKKAVFIGAHTDDEQVCAGALRRLVRQGTRVFMLTASYAATFYDRRGEKAASKKSTNEDIISEYLKSCKLIGVADGDWDTLTIIPSSDFYPHRQAICQWVYNFLQEEEPELVITLSPEDENPAHKIIGEEVERVARGRVRTLLRCQYPWNYAVGRNTVYVTLSEEDVRVKEQVCLAYKSQTFRYNYPQIFMSMARVDGLSIKKDYAEKFELVRTVL